MLIYILIFYHTLFLYSSQTHMSVSSGLIFMAEFFEDLRLGSLSAPGLMAYYLRELLSSL